MLLYGDLTKHVCRLRWGTTPSKIQITKNEKRPNKPLTPLSPQPCEEKIKLMVSLRDAIIVFVVGAFGAAPDQSDSAGPNVIPNIQQIIENCAREQIFRGMGRDGRKDLRIRAYMSNMTP